MVICLTVLWENKPPTKQLVKLNSLNYEEIKPKKISSAPVLCATTIISS